MQNLLHLLQIYDILSLVIKMKNILTTAERLKYCREQSEKTLEEIGNLVGVNKSTVMRWESGKTEKISLPIISALARYFNVSEAWLSGKNVPMKDPDSIPDGFLPPPTMVKKPRLGKISCGEPLLTEENFDGYDNVPSDIKCDFTLICQGDSMIGARIHDGDLVYIRQQPTVETGQIAAVLINGTEEKLLKRVFIHADSIVLQAENPAYSPLVFVGADMNNVRIIGKAVGFTSIIK